MVITSLRTIHHKVTKHQESEPRFANFATAGRIHATLIRDEMDQPAAVKIEKVTLTRGDALTIRMRAGGGFVARFIYPGSAEASRPS